METRCCSINRKSHEAIQRRAVKWILGEQDHHYNDIEYLSRLRDLDLMPMEFKFTYTADLILFHNIYYGQSVIKLPQYLVPITNDDRSRLRSNIRPPERFSQTESSGIPDLDARRKNRFDGLSLKCVIEAKTRPFKNSFFFRTQLVWNDLPTDLKEQSGSDVFRSNLKRHLWDVMIDPH